MSSLISAKKGAENAAIADENYKKAKKKVESSILSLRFKPDWEAAAKYYREAVKYYKMSGSAYTDQLILTLRESALAHKEIQSWHTAASDLEAAAVLMRDEKKDNQQAADLFAEAALNYRMQGASHDKAAAMLVKAGETIGEIDVNAGVEYMKQACSIFEEENRAIFHDETYKKAIAFCVKKEKFGSARSLLHRQLKLQQQHLNPFEPDMYKNCLSIIVLRFHTEDYEKAAEELQQFEQLERFARSEECLAAGEMIAAWEDGAAEKFNETMKKQVFKYLLNPIAIIARKLRMPDDVARSSKGGSGKAAASTSEEGASSSSTAAPKKSRVYLGYIMF